MLEALDDPDTEQAVTAERVIVAALSGDCHSPIAALAQMEGEKVILRTAIGSRGGDPPVLRAEATCDSNRCDKAVQEVLKSLTEQGVQKLLSPR